MPFCTFGQVVRWSAGSDTLIPTNDARVPHLRHIGNAWKVAPMTYHLPPSLTRMVLFLGYKVPKESAALLGLESSSGVVILCWKTKESAILLVFAPLFHWSSLRYVSPMNLHMSFKFWTSWQDLNLCGKNIFGGSCIWNFTVGIQRLRIYNPWHSWPILIYPFPILYINPSIFSHFPHCTLTFLPELFSILLYSPSSL